jgi:hypothetical protein
MAEQDQLTRAYARLQALRNAIAADGLPDYGLEYVDRFHEALDRIAGAGINVDEFRIGKGSISESGTFGPYIERAMLLQHLDSVLGYFTILSAKPQKWIGFRD